MVEFVIVYEGSLGLEIMSNPGRKRPYRTQDVSAVLAQVVRSADESDFSDFSDISDSSSDDEMQPDVDDTQSDDQSSGSAEDSDAASVADNGFTWSTRPAVLRLLRF